MTLIAFHAQPDRADIITDTLSYTRTARHLGHTSKVTLMPHLDAAVMTQGSTEFGKAWLSAVLTAGEPVTSTSSPAGPARLCRRCGSV